MAALALAEVKVTRQKPTAASSTNTTTATTAACTSTVGNAWGAWDFPLPRTTVMEGV